MVTGIITVLGSCAGQLVQLVPEIRIVCRHREKEGVQPDMRKS